MDKAAILEDLMHKIDDLSTAIEEQELESDDLAIARDLIDELRDEIRFRLE